MHLQMNKNKKVHIHSKHHAFIYAFPNFHAFKHAYSNERKSKISFIHICMKDFFKNFVNSYICIFKVLCIHLCIFSKFHAFVYALPRFHAFIYAFSQSHAFKHAFSKESNQPINKQKKRKTSVTIRASAHPSATIAIFLRSHLTFLV